MFNGNYLTQLDGLVHPSVPVAEVSGLWVPEVNPEAFGRAVLGACMSTSCTQVRVAKEGKRDTCGEEGKGVSCSIVCILNHMERRGGDQVWGVRRRRQMKRKDHRPEREEATGRDQGARAYPCDFDGVGGQGQG